MATNLTSLTTYTYNIEDCLEYCKNKKLLADSQNCSKCNIPCTWTSKSDKTDRYAWRCPSCRSYISVRHNSFFERSKLELSIILRLIYLWAYEMSSYKIIQRECDISSHSTIAYWTNSLRAVCNEYFFRHPSQIGGPGHMVEIDESLYFRKNNVDETAEKSLWVFGGYDPAEKEGFFLALPSQDPETLVLMIREYILPGTTIVLNCWKALDRLGDEGFQYLTADHSLNFVDPDYKPTISPPGQGQRMWKEAKNRNKKECGTNSGLVDTYLTEFMWRQKFRDNTFDAIIDQISSLYTFGTPSPPPPPSPPPSSPPPPPMLIKQEPPDPEEPSVSAVTGYH